MIQTVGYSDIVSMRWCMMDELVEGGDCGRLAAMQHAALMLASEAGEVAGIVQKGYQAAPVPVGGEARPARDVLAGIDRAKLLDELGDVRFAMEIVMLAAGVTIDEIERRNVAKLSLRYPAGFDPERSKDRSQEPLLHSGSMVTA